MVFCDNSCLLCDNPGLFAVNYAGYHRACEYHALELSKSIITTCQKCQSEVFIVSDLVSYNFHAIHEESKNRIRTDAEIYEKKQNSASSLSFKNPIAKRSDRLICPNCNNTCTELKSYCNHVVCNLCIGYCKKCKEEGMKAKIISMAKNTGGIITKNIFGAFGITGYLFSKENAIKNEDIICQNCEAKGTKHFECGCSNKVCTECYKNCKLCIQDPERCTNCNSLCISIYELKCGDKGCYKCYNNGCFKHMKSLKGSIISFEHQKNITRKNIIDPCIYCKKDTENHYYDCVHKVCFNCFEKNPVCLKSECKQCIICSNEYPKDKLIMHEIGNTCQECFKKLNIASYNDKFDEIKCSLCKKVVERLYPMNCSHKSCLKCSVMNNKCFDCSNDYSNQLHINELMFKENDD